MSTDFTANKSDSATYRAAVRSAESATQCTAHFSAVPATESATNKATQRPAKSTAYISTVYAAVPATIRAAHSAAYVQQTHRSTELRAYQVPNHHSSNHSGANESAHKFPELSTELQPEL